MSHFLLIDMYLFNPNVNVHSAILYTARNFYREREVLSPWSTEDTRFFGVASNIIFGLLGWVVHGSDVVSSRTEWFNLKWTGLTGILRDFPPLRPKCRLTPFGDTVNQSCTVHETYSDGAGLFAIWSRPCNHDPLYSDEWWWIANYLHTWYKRMLACKAEFWAVVVVLHGWSEDLQRLAPSMVTFSKLASHVGGSRSPFIAW